MVYPQTRLRRLRMDPRLREMVRENDLNPRSLVCPLFVTEGKNKKEQVGSVPGIFMYSIDLLLKEIKEIVDLKIPAVLLFGVPERRDERATGAYSKTGIVQTAVKAIKDKYPNLLLITDVCLCAYLTGGHCGIVKTRTVPVVEEAANGEDTRQEPEAVIYNDATLELLAKIALSHAEAGADMLSPSSMMDGQTSVIRAALDTNNFKHLPLMPAVVFSSAFSVPVNASCQPDRSVEALSYQLNPANSAEALREIEQDVQEGADIVMIKPALAYQDIIAAARKNFNVPIAAFSVSGEYAMVKSAGSEEKKIILEILTGLKRSGAELLITHHAREAARWLSGQFLL